jgi:hypothetical protein
MWLRLLDARRPKLGHPLEPLPRQDEETGRWTVPIAVSASMSVMLALFD